MRTLFTLISLVFVCGTYAAGTINDKKDPVASGSLEEQFDAMLERSNRYQDFKVVKRTWLDRFKVNFSDTLRAKDAKAMAQTIVITDLESDVAGLELQISNANTEIEALQLDMESMSFFGATMDRSAYKATMWTIVGILTFMGLFFLMKFKNSNILTVHAKDALDRSEEEFERFRKFSRDREQLLSRELQDEVNKRMAS